jgi:predicted DNA-binding WGR domain protein
MNYKYIGWCSDGEHDKVWVCIQLSGDRWHGKFLTVWGRRGKKLQSKIVETNTYEMEKLIRSKDAKGYVEIPEDKLNEVYPEFQQDLEKTTAWALLKS